MTGAGDRGGGVTMDRDVAVPMADGVRLRGHLRRPIDSPRRRTVPLLCGGWWP